MNGSTVNIQGNHRKLVAYLINTNGAEYGDYAEGHGTHVAGTLTGSALCSDSTQQSQMSKWNGIAYDAKLVFVDIGDMNGGIALPTTLQTYLQSFHDRGARISSHSWSCNEASGSTAYASCNSYNTKAYDVDVFSNTNDEHLVLFAAGNSGEQGLYSVKSPSTSKNCISVGATMAPAQSWEYLCSLYDNIANCDANTNKQGEGVASFSSRGWALPDTRIKPEVMLPGQYIVSSRANGLVLSNITQCSATVCRKDYTLSVCNYFTI